MAESESQPGRTPDDFDPAGEPFDNPVYSLVKRNTTLVNKDSLAHIPNAYPANITQVRATLGGCTDLTIADINSVITVWAAEHELPSSLKTHHDQDMVIPLYDAISSRFPVLFLDIDPDTCRNCVGSIIQRYISNLRRNRMHKAKKPRDASEDFSTNGHSNVISGGVFDFVIYISDPSDPQQTCQIPLLSLVKPGGPDPLQRTSLTTLCKLITDNRPDLQTFGLRYSYRHPIAYTAVLTHDMHLHTALMDSRRQRQSYAVLEFTEPCNPRSVEADTTEDAIGCITTPDPISPERPGKEKKKRSLSPLSTARPAKQQRPVEGSIHRAESMLVADAPIDDNGGDEDVSALADGLGREASIEPRIPDPDTTVRLSIEDDPSPRTEGSFENMEGLPFLPTDGNDGHYFKVEELRVEDFSLEKIQPDDEQDEDEEFGKTLTPEEKANQDMLGIIRSHQVTEHLSPENWKACCDFFLHDPDKTSPEDTFQIRGIKTPVLPFQAFGAYISTVKLAVQNGVWLADTMGLGKTLIFLVMRALHRALLLCWKDVLACWVKKLEGRHLDRSTPDHPQAANAVCPSGNRFGILCVCLDRNPLKYYTPRIGAALVLAPPGLLTNWINEMRTHLDLTDKEFAWCPRYCYQDGKMAVKYVMPLSTRDESLLRIQPAANFDRLRGHERKLAMAEANWDTSRLIVVCSRFGIDRFERVLKKEALNTRAPKRGAQRQMVWRGPDCEIGQLALDEAHLNSSGSTLFARAVARLCNGGASLIAITGTPFEKSPRKLIPWVKAFSSEEWDTTWRAIPSATTEQWEKRGELRTQLKHCTPDSILTLSKAHERLIKQTAPDIEAKRRHIHDLKRVTRTLFVQRHGRKSNFFGHPLVRLPPNDHRDITVILKPQHAKLIDDPVRQSTKELAQEHIIALQRWNSNPRRVGEPPKVNILSWLQKCRRARILSTFPELATLPETMELELTV